MKTKPAFHSCGLAMAGLLAMAAPLAMSGCDEAQEAVVCSRLAGDVCAMWFECFPTLSEARWTTSGTCADEVQYKCSHSESLYGCDLDNADLVDCEKNVDDSACGSMPRSCQDMIECYY